MTPASKRRKVAAEKYPCHTCLEDRTTGSFPMYNPTETCNHLINTCKTCLKQWVESQIETKVFTPHINCPQCDEKMKRSDVEMAVTKKVFSRYVELERRYIAENTPGWRWCLAPGCQSGQIHVSNISNDTTQQVPGTSKEFPINLNEKKGSSWTGWVRKSVRAALKAQQEKAAVQDICTCDDCGAKACVPCDRPWHESETCAEYQRRIKDRLAEEDASLAVIQKQTKQCPRCSKSIEKNGGCRHMYCTQCRSEFCWECVQLINHNGQYCACGRVPGH